MNNYHDAENICTMVFASLGECYHLWTPENFDIIFTCDEDFRAGMNIIAICSRMFPDVAIITFEIMSNHLHFTVRGTSQRLVVFFEKLKYFLKRFSAKQGRFHDWTKFSLGKRRLCDLKDMRNVIIYDNRNGYIVNPGHSPFTYPWGANRYFFNPDARKLALKEAHRMSLRERQSSSRSRSADGITDLLTYEGCALPLCFCDIATGEQLFRNASHYFYQLSRSIESDKEIAKEIGESLFYTDDELYALVSKISRDKYGARSPTILLPEAKMNLARIMRHDYNASEKQIRRMLRISPEVLHSIGIT